ncbi:cation transporter [Litorimonas haliclonae]|uniref:cation transporter n=1 Tax=Litorimonas haliclonae TaxID=2081977 RepID=UPI0039EFCCCC
MKLAPQYEFSETQRAAMQKARRLEWISIAYLISVIILMYLVMGASQTMKTAWIEDCLSLIPPICFLVGSRICWRPPSEHYPYGFHRVVSVLFLCAALALLCMGTYLLVDALIKLGGREHPTIGMKEFFGKDAWLGWWMILVLLWGTFPPVILGRAKIKYAETLHDKILITDGKMNKADWMTAVAAIGGVLGVGMGWWWADAGAAALISLDIVKDGWKQSKDAVTGLINRAPTSLDDNYLDLHKQIETELERIDWIERARVRLYEHGHLIFGDGVVKTANTDPIPPEKMREAMQIVQVMDWRVQDFSLTVDRQEDI